MGTNLFVGNLPYTTTEQQLRELFEADGRQVVDIRIATDRETGRSRGFAFVEMANESDAQAAMDAVNEQELDGRPLRVNEANERRPRGEGGGGRGGRGGRGGGGGGGRGRY